MTAKSSGHSLPPCNRVISIVDEEGFSRTITLKAASSFSRPYYHPFDSQVVKGIRYTPSPLSPFPRRLNRSASQSQPLRPTPILFCDTLQLYFLFVLLSFPARSRSQSGVGDLKGRASTRPGSVFTCYSPSPPASQLVRITGNRRR